MGRLVPPSLLLLQLLCTVSPNQLAFSAERQDEYLELRRIIGREQFREAIERCKVLIEKYPDYVYLYETMAEVSQYAGELDDAEVFFDRRIENGTELGLAYFGLGNVEYAKGDFKTAFLAYDKAVEIGVKAPECYKGLEYSFEKIEGVEAAIRYFTTLCHRNPENANFWYALALAYWGQKEYQVVLKYIREALAHDALDLKYREAQAVVLVFAGSKTEGRVKIRSLMIEAQAVADLSGLEMLLTYLTLSYLPDPIPSGRDSEIQLFLQQAKELGLFRWLGWGYARLADIASQRGEFKDELTYAERLLSLSLRISDQQLTMLALRMKITSYYDLGSYADALRVCFERLRVALAANSHLETLEALSDIALNYHELGRDEEALDFGVEAITRAQLLPENHKIQFQVHTNMGLIYEGLGSWRIALDQFSLAHREIQMGQPWQGVVAVSHGNLGRIFLRIGQVKRAQMEFFAQLFAAKRLHYPSEVAGALANLGDLFLVTGRPDSARKYFASGLREAQKLSQSALVMQCENGLGVTSEAQGDRAGAIKWYRKSTYCKEGHTISLDSWYGRSALAVPEGEAIRRCINLLCREGRVIEALQINELRTQYYPQFLSSMGDIHLKCVGDSLGLAIEALESEIGGEGLTAHSEKVLSSAGGFDEERLGYYVRLARFEDAWRSRLCEVAGIASANAPDSIVMERIRREQSLMPRNEAIIEYCVGIRETDGFLLKRDTVVHFTVRSGAADLSNMLVRASALFDPRGDGLKIWNRILANFDPIEACKLYETLIAPIEYYIDDVTKIVFVRDGVLEALPFEALVIPRRLQTSRGENVTFLVEKYAVSYAFCVLHPEPLVTRRYSDQKVLLAIAGTSESPIDARSLESQAHFLSTSKSASFRPLPGVSTEVGRIADLFGDGARTLVGTEANPAIFRAEAPEYSIIHIAGHAIMDKSRPMYSRIILPPRRKGNSGESLSAFGLLGMDLAAKLVVLSACNSARSDPGRCASGLVTGFLRAGALAVIGSLWNADDASSVDLMVRFYEHLRNGNMPSKALQLAKIDLIRSGQRDPFCWAGFVLFGDTMPVAVMRNTPRINAWVWGIIFMLVLLVMIQGEEVVKGWKKWELYGR